MNKRIWLSITLLVLASLACSLFGQAEKAIEAGKEAATRVSEVATVVGEEGGVATLVPESSGEETEGEETGGEEGETEGTEADEPAGPDIDEDALSGLESYRVRFRAEWKPEEGEPEVMTFEESHTKDPAARRLTLEGMAGGESVEIVQIEDQTWMCTGGTCNQMQGDPEELASGFSDSAMFEPSDITDEENAKFVGRETMNGVQTRHYTLDLTAMEAAFLAQGDVSDVQGEAWIADEPDLPQYAARFQMSWTEERSGVEGQASFVYETYDVNAPFTIEPPEGAAESGLPEDVPPYPNGEQTFSMAGMASCESPDPVGDVADFYRDALAGEGWTLESDDVMEEMAQQVWNKGDRTLTLVVSSEDGGSSVMISIEGGS